MANRSIELNLVELPDDLLEIIFSFFSFHEISQLREICRKFNSISSHMLKHGFCRLDQRIRAYRKGLKQALPRRESERRKHPLAGRSEVLSAIETRVSLLGMSIMRYTDEGHCAFFPGKVLDELRNVFFTLTTACELTKTQEFLHEFRDVSSMAIEYFDESILPEINALKARQCHQFRGLASKIAAARVYHQNESSVIRGLCSSKIIKGTNNTRLSYLLHPAPSTPIANSSFDEEDEATSFEVSNLSPFKTSSELNASNVPTNESLATNSTSTQRVPEELAKLQRTVGVLSHGYSDLLERNSRLYSVLISLTQRIQHLEARVGVRSLLPSSTLPVVNSNGKRPSQNWCLDDGEELTSSVPKFPAFGR